MPEICTCQHAREHHKKPDTEQPGKCRPPKDVDPRKCSCEQYVEDENQLTMIERAAKMSKQIAKTRAQNATLKAAMDKMEPTLTKDLRQALRPPK
jgi:hypothetical protein